MGGSALTKLDKKIESKKAELNNLHRGVSGKLAQDGLDRESLLKSEQIELFEQRKKWTDKFARLHTKQAWLAQLLPSHNLGFSQYQSSASQKDEASPKSVIPWTGFNNKIGKYVEKQDNQHAMFSSVRGCHLYDGDTEDDAKALYNIVLRDIVMVLDSQAITIGLSKQAKFSRPEVPSSSRAPQAEMVEQEMEKEKGVGMVVICTATDIRLKVTGKAVAVIEMERSSVFRTFSTAMALTLDVLWEEAQENPSLAFPGRHLIGTIKQVYKYMQTEQALGYVVSAALASEEPPTFKDASPAPEPGTEPSEESDEGKLDSDPDFSPKPKRLKSASTTQASLPRGARKQDTYRECLFERLATWQDTPYEDLHISCDPLAVGWSGYVWVGRLNNDSVAVKMAHIDNWSCVEALLNEVWAYDKLQNYWGRCVPELKLRGTTAEGRLVFLATKYFVGMSIGTDPLTPEVEDSALQALRVVSQCMWQPEDAARTVFVPKCSRAAVEKLLDVYTELDGSELSLQLVDLDTEAEYDMGKGCVVQPFRAYHVVPSQIDGYVICSVKKKLKAEYRHLPGREIKLLRLAGVEIVNILKVPEVAFSGDTTADFIVDEANNDALEAKLRIMEATFVNEAMSVEHARDYNHAHLCEVAALADKFKNRNIVFIHFSSRYEAEEIMRAIENLLEALKGRVAPLPKGF